MRHDYCPVANEPCQAMCLDGCRLREHSRYTAALEKERKELQSMLNQERTESEALLRQALVQLEINRTNFNKAPSKSICKMLAGGNDEIITALREALED